MKYIIAIVAEPARGKTPSIIDAIMSNPIFCSGSFTPKVLRSKKEMWRIGPYKGKKLSIASMGDTVKIIERIFNVSFDKEDCDIVVTACHPYDWTYESTLEYIRRYAKNNNIELIETSILHLHRKNSPSIVPGKSINSLFSKHLWELIDYII